MDGSVVEATVVDGSVVEATVVGGRVDELVALDSLRTGGGV